MTIQTISSLTQGISQQAPQLRRPEQAEEQVNAYPSVANGLQKRQPSVFTSTIAGSPLGAYHLVDRPFGQYIVGCTGEPDVSVTIANTDGSPNPTIINPNPAYLRTPHPEDDLKFLTIADSTFIANRQIVPTLDPDTAVPAAQSDQIVFVREGRIDTEYTAEVVVDGVESVVTVTTNPTVTTIERTTARGSRVTTTTTAASIDTEDIATRMGEALTAANISNVVVGSSILVTQALLEQVTTFDTASGELMDSVGAAVEVISDLPPLAPEGYLVEVVGDGSTDQDNYWLRFSANDADALLSEGVWVETAAPGTLLDFDANTLPHELLPVAGGFELRPVQWVSRLAGDDSTIPPPSFVGSPIRDIGYWKGRLAFITETTAVFSASDDLFRFWLASATDVVDDDPIDLALVSDFGGTLHGQAAFAEDFIVFSDREQFVIRGTGLFTPSNAEASPATRLEAQDIRPVRIGSSAYFPFTRSGFSAYYQYFVSGDNDEFQSEDITGHVPQYIPGEVRKHAASASEGLLTVLCEGDLNGVYTYKYFDSGNQRLQAAWSRWEFARPVLWVGALDSRIFVVLGPTEGEPEDVAFLTEIDVSDNFVADVHLDRRVDQSQCELVYDPSNNQTLVTLPFALELDRLTVVAGLTGPSVEGRILNFTLPEDPTNSLALRGDWTDGQFYIGNTYTMLYEFSRPFIRRQAQDGSVAILSGGRLQLRRWRVVYRETGFFQTRTFIGNREPRQQTFSGRTLGAATAIIGVPSLSDGEYSWAVNGVNDELRVQVLNDSTLPTNLTSASWEGIFVQRSR